MLDLGFANLLVLLSDAAGGVDLWATSRPSALTIAATAAALLAGTALLLVWLRDDGEEQPERAPPADLEGDLAEVRRGRAAVSAALDVAHGPVRAALVQLLESPLTALDQRVAELLDAARVLRTSEAAAERLAAERADLEGQLAHEGDARARALLQASLRDVLDAQRVHTGLRQSARLTRLELRRLKTLLGSLPLRIQDLDAQHSLDPSGLGDVESIARQLAQAVCSSGEVLGAVLLREPSPPTTCSP